MVNDPCLQLQLKYLPITPRAHIGNEMKNRQLGAHYTEHQVSYDYPIIQQARVQQQNNFDILKFQLGYRAQGIKQKKSIIHLWTSMQFLFLHSPKPRSQVRILTYRNCSMLSIKTTKKHCLMLLISLWNNDKKTIKLQLFLGHGIMTDVPCR